MYRLSVVLRRQNLVFVLVLCAHVELLLLLLFLVVEKGAILALVKLLLLVLFRLVFEVRVRQL